MENLIPADIQEKMNAQATSEFVSPEGLKILEERKAAQATAATTTQATTENNEAAAENTEAAATTTTEETTNTENSESTNTDTKILKDEELIKLFNEKAGSKFGNFEDFKDFQSRIEKLQTENEELKTFVPKNEGDREMVKALNSGISADTYLKIQQLDIDKMTAKEAVIQKLMMKDKLSREEAENDVDVEYKLGGSYDETDPEVKAKRTRLEKIAGEEAKSFIAEWKQKAIVPEAKQKVEQAQKAWEGVASRLADEVSANITYSWDGQTFKHDLTQEDKKALLADFDAALQYLPNVDPKSPEGKAIAKDMMLKQIWAEHGPKILNNVLTQHKANTIKAKANVVVPANEQKPKGAVLSPEQELLRRVEATQNQPYKR